LQQELSKTAGPCSIRSSAFGTRCAFRREHGANRFTTGFADSDAGARQLIEKYHDRRWVARALALASTHSDIELRHLGLTVEETMLFQRLSGRLMYGDPRLRQASAVLRNVRGQAELWKYGISGDLADPALAHQGHGRDRAASGICSERMNTCAARAWSSTSSC
jgi:cellobiose phosphorylase